MAATHIHVQRMLDLIERSYAEPITLNSIGTALDRQGSYLGGLFRREVGLSVRQWLTRLRMERATALIQEGVKIEAVALLVGYRSKKNFYRQFKRRYATTPFAYGAARALEGPLSSDGASARVVKVDDSAPPGALS